MAKASGKQKLERVEVTAEAIALTVAKAFNLAFEIWEASRSSNHSKSKVEDHEEKSTEGISEKQDSLEGILDFGLGSRGEAVTKLQATASKCDLISWSSVAAFDDDVTTLHKNFSRIADTPRHPLREAKDITRKVSAVNLKRLAAAEPLAGRAESPTLQDDDVFYNRERHDSANLTINSPTSVKRRSSFNHQRHHHNNQAGLKFASSPGASNTRGMRPLPEPVPMKDLIQMLVVVACKKVIFLDVRIRICIYLAFTFLLSIFADAAPFPKTYFSDSKNGLNYLFTSFGWGWTLLTTGALVWVVEIVRHCGDTRKVVTFHLTRLVVATLMWWAWTTAFVVLEKSTGSCLVGGAAQVGFGKRSCRDSGGRWRSKEDYFRLNQSVAVITGKPENQSDDETYLKDLTPMQFETLKHYYFKFAVAARAAFFVMTLLSLTHDVLLLATLIYFHVMTEKLLAAAIAICMWFVLYRIWFVIAPFPLQPGAGGCFKFDVKHKGKTVPRKRDEGRTGRRASLITPDDDGELRR
ncbi:unnamed protein product [Notodromas monacha]|nr:unnamed protein product [Notodromas monacha]CAG0914158.1 unnamed protein product [Notodromas monacha]